MASPRRSPRLKGLSPAPKGPGPKPKEPKHVKNLVEDSVRQATYQAEQWKSGSSPACQTARPQLEPEQELCRSRSRSGRQRFQHLR